LLALTDTKGDWPPRETFIHQLKMRCLILQMKYLEWLTWCMLWVMYSQLTEQNA